MTQPNRVALALSAIFGGAAAGGAVGTVGVWIANWMAMNGMTPLGDPANVVFLGNGLGLLLGLYLGWGLSAGLEETWRRAAIGVTAAFGAVAAGMAAYPLAILSLILTSQLAQLLVPGYFVVMVVIWYVSIRVARRQHQAVAAAATAAPPAM